MVLFAVLIAAAAASAIQLRAPTPEEAAQQMETTGEVVCPMTDEEKLSSQKTGARVAAVPWRDWEPWAAGVRPYDSAGCGIYKVTVDWRGNVIRTEVVRAVGNLPTSWKDKVRFRAEPKPTTKTWTGIFAIIGRAQPDDRARAAATIRSAGTGVH